MEAENFVQLQEQKDADRLRFVFVTLFALGALFCGMSALNGLDALLARLALTWDGFAAASQLAQPIIFALLAIREYKAGDRQ